MRKKSIWKTSLILALAMMGLPQVQAGVPISSYEGEWNSTTKYPKGQVISYHGLLYVSLKNNLDKNPGSDNAFWQLISVKGEKGDVGATGPQGPKGDTGAQGPSGTHYFEAKEGDPCTIPGSKYVNTGTLDTVIDNNGPISGQTLYLACNPISWDLSKDILAGFDSNPFGPWSLMYDSTAAFEPTYNQSNYKLFDILKDYILGNSEGTPRIKGWSASFINPIHPYYTAIALTSGAISNGYPIHQNMVILQPNQMGNITRWISPLTKNISITGNIEKLGANCGDGIAWNLKLNAEELKTGVLNSQGANSVISITSINVSKGDILDLYIDGLETGMCDEIGIELIITKLN